MDATSLVRVIDEWTDRLASLSERAAMEVVGSRWTRKEVLGHLIDSAANNHHRFVRLQQGDLEGFPGYEQDAWVAAGNYNRNAWRNIVGLWNLYNRQLAIVIENADQSCEGNRWKEKDVDFRFLVEDYVAHMLHHLRQIG